MNFKSIKLLPMLIAASVIGLVCALDVLPYRYPKLDAFQRLEWMTYDWRTRQAHLTASPPDPRLAFVGISDNSIAVIASGEMGFEYGLYWPRQLYGRLVRELAAQNARAVAVDIVLGELRPDHPTIELPDNTEMGSDAFFADQIQQAGNVVLAATKGVVPPEWFRTNAWALGDVSVEKDSDGILRRAYAYQDYRIWHPSISRKGLIFWDLAKARVHPDKIIFPKLDPKDEDPHPVAVALDEYGFFDPAQVDPDSGNQERGLLEKAFVEERVWHMGIVLAARQLGLDLAKAIVDRPHHQILLRGTNGVDRAIPVDDEARFLIEWTLLPTDVRLTAAEFDKLISKDILRSTGNTNDIRDPRQFRDKLILVGSTATGNDLTDQGVTPLGKETYLTSTHLNVANAVLTGAFIRQYSIWQELLLITVMGLFAAFLTVELSAFWASFWVVVAAVVYIGWTVFFFTEQRFWLPIVMPVFGGLLGTHVSLITYRMVFEQRERRRIRSVFAKIVSPNVVHELLQAERVKLGGARRKVTVFFADVRGFTEFTDIMHARAEEYVRDHQLAGAEAETYFDQQAREALDTVNLYLSAIADVIKKYEGTLDKYIGDCVMAFWGAPTPNDQHAVSCVRAAIEAQRTIYGLNQGRVAENKRREQENVARTAAGQPLLPMQPLLALGTGINSGISTVGLMGSEDHILNYTVFGREVNLASRLEGVSGRGRIIISEATYQELLRDDPPLAATCVSLPAVQVKGIKGTVKIYEVPWKAATGVSPAAPAETVAAKPPVSGSPPAPAPAPATKS